MLEGRQSQRRESCAPLFLCNFLPLQEAENEKPVNSQNAESQLPGRKMALSR